MRRWTFILTIILITMTTKGYAEDYYSQLKEIEANNLNGNEQLKASLENLSESFDKFTDQEKNYYNLLQGHSHYMHGEFSKVVEVLSPVIDNAKDVNIKARAISIVATAEWIVGNTVESFIQLDKAISLLPKVKVPRYRISILQNASGIYKEAELIEYALEKARRLKIEAEKDGEPLSICAANYELASIELMADKLKMAKSRLLLAKQHCEKSGMIIFQIGIEDSLARIELEEGEYDKGIKRLRAVLPIAMESGWGMGIATTKTHLAQHLFQIGQFDEAETHALFAYRISSESNDKRRMQAASSILAQIYSETDKKEKAIKYYNEFRKLNSSNKIKVRQRKMAFDIARRGKL